MPPPRPALHAVCGNRSYATQPYPLPLSFSYFLSLSLSLSFPLHLPPTPFRRTAVPRLTPSLSAITCIALSGQLGVIKHLGKGWEVSIAGRLMDLESAGTRIGTIYKPRSIERAVESRASRQRRRINNRCVISLAEFELLLFPGES